MSVVLRIDYTGGRMHATRWGSHRNGTGERPVSQRRILCALIAAAYGRYALGTKELAAALAAVLRLAVPPTYTLPPMTEGHVASYVPTHKTGTLTALHDHFFAVGGPIYVTWPVDLTEEEMGILRDLAGRVGYLGRAESWCDMAFVDKAPEANTWPLRPGDEAPAGYDTERVLCVAPTCTVAQISATVSEILAQRVIDPPGSMWVQYAIPPLGAAPSKGHEVASVLPTVAELSLSGTVLPWMREAREFATLVRKACMRLHDVPSAVFSGHADDGAPVRTQHQHAHFIPEARGRDPQRVTHIVVWAPGGIGESEQAALRNLRRIRGGKWYGHPIDAVVTGFGQPEDFASASPACGTGREWATRTPFLAGRDVRDVAGRVRRELAWRGMPDPAEVVTEGQGQVRIRWEAPVRGPVLLGYGCHHGAGQFAPAG